MVYPHNGYLLIAEAVTYVAPETQLAPARGPMMALL